jgi:hypothetical protein
VATLLKVRRLRTVKKIPSVVTIICAALGVPLAGLVFLAGGMKTVPGLELEELLVGLPLVTLAVLFGGMVIVRSRRSKASIPKLVLASVVCSSLAVIVLLSTYLEYR